MVEALTGQDEDYLFAIECALQAEELEQAS
jgi:hypothetical protein